MTVTHCSLFYSNILFRKLILRSLFSARHGQPATIYTTTLLTSFRNPFTASEYLANKTIVWTAIGGVWRTIYSENGVNTPLNQINKQLEHTHITIVLFRTSFVGLYSIFIVCQSKNFLLKVQLILLGKSETV